MDTDILLRSKSLEEPHELLNSKPNQIRSHSVNSLNNIQQHPPFPDEKTTHDNQTTEKELFAHFIVGYFKKSQLSDKMCCKLIPKYPTFWPRVYVFNVIFSNCMRIFGLISDLIFFIASMQWNSKFMDFKSDDSTVPSPFTAKSDVGIRFLFTFLPGIIIFVTSSCILRIIAMKRGGTEASGMKDVIKTYEELSNNQFCYIICLGLFMFGYKIIMIAVAIACIVQSLSIWKQPIVTQADINNLFQIKAKQLFWFESIVSSWPLWVMSFIALQQSLFDQHKIQNVNFWFVLTIIKVISSGFTILISSDKFGFGRAQTKDPIVIFFVCKQHLSEPASSVVIEDSNITSQDNYSCIECEHNLCDNQGTHFYFCPVDGCNKCLCYECGWKLIIQFKIASKMDCQALYLHLWPPIQKAYYEQLNLIYNDIGDELTAPLFTVSINKVPQREKDIRKKPCKPSSWWKNFDNILVLIICGLMWRVVYKVLFTTAYDGNYLLIDAMAFIFVASGLLILCMIFKFIQFLISRCCGRSQKLSVFVRWSANAYFQFYLFGFTMALFSFDRLWDIGGDIAAALVLYCIHLSLIALSFCCMSCNVFAA